MPGERKYQTFWLRFLAFIIDGIVVFLLRMALLFLAGELPSVSALLIIAAIIPFLPFVYTIALHSIYGQTLGKMLFGVKLVGLDETKKVSMKQAVGRDVIPLCLLVFGFLSLRLFDFTSTTVSTQMAIITITSLAIAWLPAIWTLVEVLTMLFHPKRRALQDRLTKSVVVKTNKHAFTN